MQGKALRGVGTWLLVVSLGACGSQGEVAFPGGDPDSGVQDPDSGVQGTPDLAFGDDAVLAGSGTDPNCQKRTCADQGIECGAAGDGCGGLIECGACGEGLRCGGPNAP